MRRKGMGASKKMGQAGAKQREEVLEKKWPWLLPLAAGIFLGASIIEMLPEP
jgi:hypothetical protein